MSTTITIEVPDDLLARLDLPQGSLPALAKEWMALELYREGRVSSGTAAAWLGLDRSDFIDLLARRRLPYVDHPASDLSRDVATALSAAENSGE